MGNTLPLNRISKSHCSGHGGGKVDMRTILHSMCKRSWTIVFWSNLFFFSSLKNENYRSPFALHYRAEWHLSCYDPKPFHLLQPEARKLVTDHPKPFHLLQPEARKLVTDYQIPKRLLGQNFLLKKNRFSSLLLYSSPSCHAIDSSRTFSLSLF